MRPMTVIASTGIGLALAVGCLAAVGAQEAAVRLNTDAAKVMMHGYDVVAFFTDEKAVKGTDAFEYVWQGATWRFATADHRSLFQTAPEKYAPQYGGFCAWAVSRNYTADTDPEAWVVVNGRLFLNYSKNVQKQWTIDRDANISKADVNWPALARGKK